MARFVPAVFVLFLLGLACAATQTKTLSWYDQSTKLYETESAGYSNIYVTPGFNGGFTTTLTTGSRVLDYGPGGGLDGSKMCPGASLSLDSSMSSQWSASAFYASAILSEGCTPSTSSATAGNYPVSWDQGNYEAIKDWSICYNNFANCWAKTGTLYDKRVNMYLGGTPSVPQYFYNRQGTIGVVCWGTRTPSASTPSGSYPGLSASDTGATSWHNDFSFSNAGVYTINDGFEVKGCAATVRHPYCSGQIEETMSRLTSQAGYDAAEYYTDLGANAFTVTIENRQHSITCGPTNPTSPITVASGSGAVVAVTIYNSGDVATRVTGVSTNPSTPVSASPFNIAAHCGNDVPSNTHPCDLGSNGFNAVLASHASETVYLWVTSSAAAGTTATTSLLFTYSTTISVCNSQNPAACTISGVRVTTASTDTCSVTDGTMPVIVGDSRTFFVNCAHQGNPLGTCSGSSVGWAASPAGFGTLQSADIQHAVIQFPHVGTGDVVATVSGGFVATCKYSASAQNVTVVPNPSACRITDGTMPVTVGESRTFNIECSYNNSPYGSCSGSSVTWGVTPGGFATLGANDYQSALVTFPNVGTGDVAATTHGSFNASCSYSASAGQQIIVIPVPQACLISDGTMPVFVNTSRTFNITCSYNNSPFGICSNSNVVWRIVPSNFATLGANDYQSAEVTFPNIGTGDINATVSGGFNTSCLYSASGQPIIVIENITRCAVTPNPASVGFLEVGNFYLACYGASGNQLPCGFATWALNGLVGLLFNAGPGGASFVMLSGPGSTGTLEATVGTVTCASNVTAVAPTNTLDVLPPSVTLNQNDSQVFNASCTAGGTATACSGVLWNPFATLVGSISGSSDTGTTYLATVDNVTTQLWACAFSMHPTPCNWADIVVGAGGSGCTGPTCGGGPGPHGSSDVCTMFGPFEVFPGANHYSVLCGPITDLKYCDPTKVSWTVSGGGSIPGPSSGVSDVFLYPGGTGSGTLTASVPGGTCFIPFTLGQRQCIQYS